jgi:hypothetical protein
VTKRAAVTGITRSERSRKLGLEHRSELVHFALETALIGAE